MTQVLYRDAHLVAVAKPSGHIVTPGGAPDAPVLMKQVRDGLGQWVYPVHRLDRGTSGVVLFALDGETAALVQEAFNAGLVRKRYLALVRGVTPERGVVDHPLPNKDGGRKVPAQTEYRRLGIFDRFSLVEASPLTGRTHQIRKHMKHISHPLVGDVNYGKGDINRFFRRRFGLGRLALHALALSLPHPRGGEPVSVTAAVPPDLAEPLGAMGLWGASAST